MVSSNSVSQSPWAVNISPPTNPPTRIQWALTADAEEACRPLILFSIQFILPAVWSESFNNHHPGLLLLLYVPGCETPYRHHHERHHRLSQPLKIFTTRRWVVVDGKADASTWFVFASQYGWMDGWLAVNDESADAAPHPTHNSDSFYTTEFNRSKRRCLVKLTHRFIPANCFSMAHSIRPTLHSTVYLHNTPS